MFFFCDHSEWGFHVASTPERRVWNMKQHIFRNLQFCNGKVVGGGIMLEPTIDNQPVVLLAVDLSIQETLREKMEYLERKLLSYSIKIKGLFSFTDHLKLYNVPIVLCGYFNIDFKSDDGKHFRRFMYETFGCTLNDYVDISTTQNILNRVDGIFTRNTSFVQTINYISFFSNHIPLVSVTIPIKSDTEL